MAFPRPIPISTDPLLPPPPLPFFSLFRNRYYFFSFINIFNMDGRYPSQMSQMGAGSGSGDRGERRRAAPPWHSPATSPSPPTPSTRQPQPVWEATAEEFDAALDAAGRWFDRQRAEIDSA